MTDSYPLLSTISGVSKGLATYNTTFDTESSVQRQISRGGMFRLRTMLLSRILKFI